MRNWLKYTLFSFPLVSIFSARHLHEEAKEMTEEERKKLGRRLGWTAGLVFIVGAGAVITVLALGVVKGSWSLAEASPIILGMLILGGCMLWLVRV